MTNIRINKALEMETGSLENSHEREKKKKSRQNYKTRYISSSEQTAAVLGSLAALNARLLVTKAP